MVTMNVNNFSKPFFPLASISLKIKIFVKIHSKSFEILFKKSALLSFYLCDLIFKIPIVIALNFSKLVKNAWKNDFLLVDLEF